MTPGNCCVEIPERAHCFVVDIGRNIVGVYEVFSTQRVDPGATRERILRCKIARRKWNTVAGDIAFMFNRRAKEHRMEAGKWHAGENHVERLIGKEMLVLLWAIEADDVSASEIQTAIRNWLGFNPEERWWLCTAASARLGGAEHRGMGWRGALRVALCFDETKQEQR